MTELSRDVMAWASKNIHTENARLPVTYATARTALSECARIDECMEWANKAEALATYARIADDDALEKMCIRIKARAIRRVGELLQEFDGRGRPEENKADDNPNLSQRQAAENAGLSHHQQKTAVRISNIPTESFEEWIESDTPPKVTALAEAGKKPRAAETAPQQFPEGFGRVAQAIGTIRWTAEACAKHDPQQTAEAILPHEIDDILKNIEAIYQWLDVFMEHFKGEDA